MELSQEARDYFKKKGSEGGKKLVKKRGKKYMSELVKKRWNKKTPRS